MSDMTKGTIATLQAALIAHPRAVPTLIQDAIDRLSAQVDAAHEANGDPLTGKYADVLAPFVAMMERELHANSGKGDRPGWLSMDRKTALLEIFYHVAKLQKATKDNNLDGIREYAADVANMAMMLADVCGVLEANQESCA